MSSLQNCVDRIRRSSVQSAETNRSHAVTCIEGVIEENHHLEPVQKLRLHRILTVLKAAQSEPPQRKYETLTDFVVPTLVTIGLVKEPA